MENIFNILLYVDFQGVLQSTENSELHILRIFHLSSYNNKRNIHDCMLKLIEIFHHILNKTYLTGADFLDKNIIRFRKKKLNSAKIQKNRSRR